MRWHDRVMTLRLRRLLLLACFVAGITHADVIMMAGRVNGEGGVVLEAPTVQIDGRQLVIDAVGNFEFPVDADSAKPLRIEISAKGYYASLQTVHRSDFVAGSAAGLPAIELVRRKAGRRLLLFAGDAMLSRRYFTPLAGEPVLVRESHIAEDGRKLLQHIKPYIELADYASVNLETQLSAETLTERLPKSVTFYSPPEIAETLQWAGFDYVALGNNHMFDYLDAGLKSTFDALDQVRLDYSGGGFDDAKAREPAMVDIDGSDHAFLSYVGWGGTFSPSQVAEDQKGGAALGNTQVIAADLAKIPDAATAVVQLHAGLEYSAQPAMSEQTTLRQAIRDGADVVVGHHAHVVQGFEIYDDSLIAYSMGNFLFDQYHYTTQLGMLLYVWMDGDRLHRAEVVPLHINGYVPTPATGAFRYSVLHRLARLSDPDSVCMSASGLHAAIRACEPGEATEPQLIDVAPTPDSTFPVALRGQGASPLLPVELPSAGEPYRLGVDILRRGDFEYAGLFGTKDRTWIVDHQTRLATGEAPRLHVEIAAGDAAARTGLKVFERVFTVSNPATVSGRIKVDGDVRLRVLLQRRRTTDSLDVALAAGPTTQIGVADLPAGGWREFAFDYNQPRIATRSVRLLFEVEDLSGQGVSIDLDDLGWVEWHTPWMGPDENHSPVFATHLQFQE